MNAKIVLKVILKDTLLEHNTIETIFSCFDLQVDMMRYNQVSKSKTSKFDKTAFFKLLEKLILSNGSFSLDAYSAKEDVFCLLKKEENIYVNITVDSTKFNEHKDLMFNLLNSIFSDDFGIVSYIRAQDDRMWQNMEQINFYEAHNKPYNHLKLIQSPIFKNEKIIDIEQNPGHDHVVNNLWFGSCWAMWFGKDYYNYISPRAIESFTECYENIELGNGSRRVLLFDNILNFEDINNRKIQKKFRDVTGMDEVAHSLMKKPLENIDPGIEILSGSYDHGGTKLMRRYMDIGNETIKKSKAKKVEIREFEVINNQWKTIWHKVMDI